jgi:hypothetical protein
MRPPDDLRAAVTAFVMAADREALDAAFDGLVEHFADLNGAFAAEAARQYRVGAGIIRHRVGDVEADIVLALRLRFMVDEDFARAGMAEWLAHALELAAEAGAGGASIRAQARRWINRARQAPGLSLSEDEADRLRRRALLMRLARSDAT